jgi:ubiquitin carboxyl-terminal hydrolase 4/11/15
MSNYCSNSHSPDDFVQDDIPALYDLFAVTNHFGRLGFGHYTAFARSWDEQGMDSEWALFDDSSVRSVDADNVVSPAAYVLFYRRRNFN